MQTENLTDQQRNDLLRKQLWIYVYTIYLKDPQTRISCEKGADIAVKSLVL